MTALLLRAPRDFARLDLVLEGGDLVLDPSLATASLASPALAANSSAARTPAMSASLAFSGGAISSTARACSGSPLCR